MSVSKPTYLGRGIYSVPDAARLVRLPATQVRRWFQGYTYRVRGAARRSAPVVRPTFPQRSGEIALSFADLIEIRFIHAFRDQGVSLRAIRIAAEKARELLGTKHPFSTERFRTLGRSIVAEIAREAHDPELLDLVDGQLGFHEMLAPYLRGLEISRDDLIHRWWPLDPVRSIVIDPRRAFGQPIVDRGGVPTSVLASAMQVEESLEAVARIYRLEVADVADAIEFERQLAA